MPAGFSQEREVWVELRVTDARGATVYEVGVLPRPDADLADKRLLEVTTGDVQLDGAGRAQGMFGADVRDGPDVPRWSPDPRLGATRTSGRGLVNLQNGFQRCVRCIGFIDDRGACQPGPGQGLTRADRFADGDYDLDTGECRSNLTGDSALFETYFPVGALDAGRGVAKAPDAIVTPARPHRTSRWYSRTCSTPGATRRRSPRARVSSSGRFRRISSVRSRPTRQRRSVPARGREARRSASGC